MTRVAVLGGGMVGSLIASELSKSYRTTVIDNNDLNLEGIKVVKIDVSGKSFSEEIKKYDFAVNCLPGFMGFEILQTLIELKIPCTDISFMPEDCLELDDLAIRRKCTVIPDAGVAPGLSNLIVGNIVKNNDLKKIKIMVGGLPKEKTPPWNYKAPFSPIDVIEEYTRPARIVINGKIETRKALSDLERFEVEGIGELEAFLTDGLRTLLYSDNKISRIPNMSEHTIRYPGHANLVQKMIDKGEFSDNIVTYKGRKISVKEKTCKELFELWKLDGQEEFTILIIIAETNDGREITYTVYDDKKDGWSSMSRTTGLTACAISHLLIDGKIDQSGIICPEIIGQNDGNFEFVIQYLKERGIEIKTN
ncbi:MAG: saccharopine dehydrogenase C-terminal domain-containing protein [Candidatus Poseidoniales archaeon]